MAKNKKKGAKSKQVTHDNPVKDPPSTNGHIPEKHQITEQKEEVAVEQMDDKNDVQSPQPHSDSTEQLKTEVEPENELKDESVSLRADLVKVQEERDQFEHQYNTLLSRLSSMKTVFSKMKESQAELENCQEQLREYESQNLKLSNKLDSSKRENSELQSTIVTLNQEIFSLNGECEALSEQYSQAKNKIEDLEEKLEVISSSHKVEREALLLESGKLKERIQELGILLDNSKQDMNTITQQVEDYQQQIENSGREIAQLEKSLQETEEQLQTDALNHKNALNEKEAEINALQIQLKETRDQSSLDNQKIVSLEENIISMREDVDKKTALEQECKERVLQIGKLRHEAIILNEHLTKALAMLKQNNDSENVDKELISNLFISFVSIPRGDPKKFEVLELISSFLSWDDDKKQQAGLIHSANGLSMQKSNSSTENFVSLWTDFLEKESEK